MSRATSRPLPVIVTRRFERALGRLLDHYESVCHLYADAGSRALQLVDMVENELPHLLSAQPDVGRRALLSIAESQAENDWLARLATLTAGRRLQAREWRVSDFWMLYYRSSSAVYLVSARHEREAGYG